MPKAFSLPLMTFDRDPDDSQLVWLLGDQECSGAVGVEEAGVLTVRPRLLPMKVIVPWVIMTGIVITCMLCFLPLWQHKKLDFSWVRFWPFTLLMWLGCIPTLLIILTAVNSTFAKKGNYFKVDSQRRTLELCQAGRTLQADEIIALTVLVRWYRCAGWDRTYQTGVLVRGADGQVEHYPLVRELGENTNLARATHWADRVASILNVPVRRIELDRQQSKALGDC